MRLSSEAKFRLTLAVIVMVGGAPLWIFFARMWWEGLYAVVTKPWSELFCVGVTACAA